ncbi:MAG: hypothetical protein QM776_05845 [Rhodocyclaceae bacterium]
MRQLLQRHGNHASWASLIVLVIGFLVFASLQQQWPDWFCEAINPGSPEMVCGYEYSVPLVKAASFAYELTLATLYLFGLCSVPFNGPKNGGKIVLVLLTILAVVACWYGYEHRHDDSP